MQNNWPILVAALFMAGAVSYGLIRQNELEEASRVEQPVRALPDVYVAVSPDAPAVAQMPVVSQPTATNFGVAPAPLAQPRQVVPAVQDVGLPPLMPGTDYGAALTGVRNALIQRFGVRPYATAAASGIGMALNGVRVEIEPSANWTVTLYNTNTGPNTAGVQNDTFVAAENVIAGQLGIDLTAPPTVTADNKHTLKTQSKLGRVSVVTDPALNNTVQIRPLQKRAVPAGAGVGVGPGPVGRPLTIPAPPVAKPGTPVPPAKPVLPTAPPKAPGADQF